MRKQRPRECKTLAQEHTASQGQNLYQNLIWPTVSTQLHPTVCRPKDPILDPTHFLSVLLQPLALSLVEGTKFLIGRLHCAYCLNIDY